MVSRAVLAFSALVAIAQSKAVITNLCKDTVYIWSIPNGNSAAYGQALLPGSQYIESFRKGPEIHTGWSVKVSGIAIKVSSTSYGIFNGGEEVDFGYTVDGNHPEKVWVSLDAPRGNGFGGNLAFFTCFGETKGPKASTRLCHTSDEIELVLCGTQHTNRAVNSTFSREKHQESVKHSRQQNQYQSHVDGSNKTQQTQNGTFEDHHAQRPAPKYVRPKNEQGAKHYQKTQAAQKYSKADDSCYCSLIEGFRPGVPCYSNEAKRIYEKHWVIVGRFLQEWLPTYNIADFRHDFELSCPPPSSTSQVDESYHITANATTQSKIRIEAKRQACHELTKLFKEEFGESNCDKLIQKIKSKHGDEDVYLGAKVKKYEPDTDPYFIEDLFDDIWSDIEWNGDSSDDDEVETNIEQAKSSLRKHSNKSPKNPPLCPIIEWVYPEIYESIKNDRPSALHYGTCDEKDIKKSLNSPTHMCELYKLACKDNGYGELDCPKAKAVVDGHKEGIYVCDRYNKVAYRFARLNRKTDCNDVKDTLEKWFKTGARSGWSSRHPWR